MANENINIVVRDTGSDVVIRNFKRMGDEANRSQHGFDRLNQTLHMTQNNITNTTNIINRMNNGAHRAQGGINGLTRSLRNMFTIILAISGASFSLASVTNAVDSYTSMQNKLRLVADSQGQVNTLQQEMFRIANKTRMAVDETTTTFQRFDLALRSVGKSQRESLRVTESVNKLVAMSGLGAQESAAALLQLSQAFSKGKLDGDEFRTVAETMPLFMDALAKHFGVTRGELLQLRKEGKITTEAMVKALTDAQADIDAAFAKTEMRISDSLVIMKNNWTKFWGEINENTRFAPAVARGIVWLSEHFKELLVVATGVIIAIGLLWKAHLVAQFAAGTGMLFTFQKTLKATWALMLANPFALVIAGIAAFLAYIILFEDELRKSTTSWAKFCVGILDMLDAISYGWRAIFSLIDELTTSNDNATKNQINNAKKAAHEEEKWWNRTIDFKTQGFWKWLELYAQFMDMVVTLGMSAHEWLFESIKNGWENIFKAVNVIYEKMANGLKETVNDLMVGLGKEAPFEIKPVIEPEFKGLADWNAIFEKNHTTFAQDAVVNAAQTVQADAKARRDARTKTFESLREANPDAAAAAAQAAANAEADKHKRRVTLAEKTAQDALKHARGLNQYLGQCAKYLNDTLVKHIPSYRRAASGIHVARNAVATGRYRYIKYDENYVPQVGDIQSMTSWTAKGRIHGHSAMYTKSGWVSDARQKTYGDGRIGAASQDQYNRLARGEGQIYIARPIDSKEDNRTFQRQYEAILRQKDAYDDMITKIQAQIDKMGELETPSLAQQKRIEMIAEMRQKDVNLTDEQLKQISDLATRYENAAIEKQLREWSDKRKEELQSVQAILFHERVELQLQQKINEAKNSNKILDDDEIANLREELTLHEQAMQFERDRNEVYKTRLGTIEQMETKLQNIQQMMANGEIGGAYGDRALTTAQFGLMRQRQGAGQTAFGGAMGNSWEEVWGSMLTGADKLLEGYTGTLNDLSDQFGQFFSSIGDGFANTIGQAVTQGKDLGEALKDVARNALGQLIAGLVKLGIQWALNAMIGATIQRSAITVATTQSTTAAATVAAAWATAASFVSLATMGSNASGAMMAISSVTAYANMMAASSSALSGGLGALKGFAKAGFASGGYTGNGARDEIAGVVHGQEFVMNADATRRIGVSTLQRMQDGELHPSSVSGGNGGGNGGGTNLNVTIVNNASGVTHEVQQLSENEVRIIARREAEGVVNAKAGEVVAGHLGNPNSKVSKAFDQNYGAVRQRQ